MSRFEECVVEKIERCTGRQGWLLDYGGREAADGIERSDAARNRRRILETAGALFGERGVTKVTMEEISRASGVGKGTLYRRFPHKGLLCQALLDGPTREFQRDTLQMIGDSGVGPVAKLGRFLDSLVRFTEENLDLIYGGFEPLCGAERLAHLSHPAHDWMRWTVLGLLKESERERELKSGLDLEYLSTALLAPLEIDVYYHQRLVLGYTPERIGNGLRSLIPHSD